MSDQLFQEKTCKPWLPVTHSTHTAAVESVAQLSRLLHLQYIGSSSSSSLTFTTASCILATICTNEMSFIYLFKRRKHAWMFCHRRQTAAPPTHIASLPCPPKTNTRAHDASEPIRGVINEARHLQLPQQKGDSEKCSNQNNQAKKAPANYSQSISSVAASSESGRWLSLD